MKNKSRVVMLVDRSGSMEIIRQATVNGINEFINSQKLSGNRGTLKLVEFDSNIGKLDYKVVFDNKFEDLKPISLSQFVPRGMTPLFDAIGKTIDDLGYELRALREEDRPEHVIVCIVTDGEENVSSDYSREKIKQTIEHQIKKYNWDFSYIGANQDAFKVGSSLGVLGSKTMSYKATTDTTLSMFKSAGQYVNSVSRSRGVSGQSVSFTEEDKRNAQR